MIASKKPFSLLETKGITTVRYERLNIFQVHFNSFSSSKRLEETKRLVDIFSGNVRDTIVMGDTNIWSKGSVFLFPKDKQAYLQLNKSFVDISKKCTSTSLFGFGLDKIFASKDVVVKNVDSPKIRGQFMDHHPLYVDII